MVREARQRDVERTLANLGWRLARTKGGHNVWVSPDGKMLAIPRHRVVSAGVVRQAIRTLGHQAPQEWKVEVMTAFKATATREGRWWIIHLDDVDGATTQARHARDIPEMAAGVVQALLDLDEPPEVEVTIKLPADAAAAWAEAADLHQRAEDDERRAAGLRRQVVRQLLEEGWSQIDASIALGLSHQRVQQLARPPAAR